MAAVEALPLRNWIQSTMIDGQLSTKTPPTVGSIPGPIRKKIACHSPLVYHHLVAGKHHFSVYAIDSRPVADPTPAKVAFTTK